MYSIICPTMWRSKGLEIMVKEQRLLDNPDVAELLIINNDPSKTVKLEHPKIKTIYSGPNIFVNPAWNYGVYRAIAPWVALLSDDIVFDPSVFSQLKMNAKSGVVGLGEGCDVGPSGHISRKKVSVHLCTQEYRFYEQQFGMLMLMHRAAYCPIPEEAKIFLGDVWLYDYNNHRGVANYFINNLDVVMQRGATSGSPDLAGIGLHELQNSKYFFEKNRGLFTLTATSAKLLG